MPLMEALFSPTQRAWFRACTRYPTVTQRGYAVPILVKRRINDKDGEALYSLRDVWSDCVPLLEGVGARSYTDTPDDDYYPPVTWLAKDYFSRPATKQPEGSKAQSVCSALP